MYNEGIIAVRAKLKGGKMRYVPMRPELGSSCDGIPPCSARIVFSRRKSDATCGRQRVEGSFEDLLEKSTHRRFPLHDLRHTFASWYMMHGGDLYALAKILGRSNIKMTERYAKLARKHLVSTDGTAREMWKLRSN